MWRHGRPAARMAAKRYSLSFCLAVLISEAELKILIRPT